MSTPHPPNPSVLIADGSDRLNDMFLESDINVKCPANLEHS